MALGGAIRLEDGSSKRFQPIHVFLAILSLWAIADALTRLRHREAVKVLDGVFDRRTHGRLEQNSTTENHFIETDGLLHNFVGALQQHPIEYLIEQANFEWENKLQRQSKSLQEAVVEYRRRYDRNPPKGFDEWVKFAIDNKVNLPDEYDQIDRDLRPFFAIPPEEFRKRAAAISQDEDNRFFRNSFILHIKDGKFDHLSGPWGDGLGRSGSLRDLVKPIAHYLPDMNVTTWFMDEPALHTSGDRKAHLTSLADQHRMLNSNDLVDDKHSAEFVGWEAFCPRDSAMHAFANGQSFESSPGRSFIAEHSQSANICQHPDIVPVHSLTATHNYGDLKPTPFYPLFCMSKAAMFSDILSTPLEQYSEDPVEDIEWAEKSEARLFWRGGTTGGPMEDKTHWRHTQRLRLVALANRNEGASEVMSSNLSPWQTLRYVLRDNDEISKTYFDIGFSNTVQCSEDDGTCDAIKTLYRMADGMSQEEANKYKYFIDTDGNGWSGRYPRLLKTNSAVLKSTIFPGWYMDRIQAWVHYIPVKVDYSDLIDIMNFFAGGPHDEGRDDLAKEIGAAGKQWALQNWRMADMRAYMLRLYLEYARLLYRDQDGNGMDFEEFQ